MYIIFHIHLCLSISFHIAGTFISDLRSPLKISKRRSVKRQKQYPILAECLIQWSREAEEKKEKYYSFFLSPCVTPLLFQIISHHSLSCDLTAAFNRWKNRQGAANQVSPKLVSLAPVSQARSLPSAAKASWFLHNEQKSPLASQNSQHIPHSGFGNHVRSLGNKLQEKSCIPVPSRIWRGWTGDSRAEGQRSLVQLAGPPGPVHTSRPKSAISFLSICILESGRHYTRVLSARAQPQKGFMKLSALF